MAHFKVEKFVLTDKARNLFLGLSALGLVLVIVGLFVHSGQEARFWTNILLSNFFFTAISVTAVAWIAINYIANSGWSTALKRIPEAMGGYLPIGAAVFAILIIFSYIPIGGHHSGIYNIFHWLHMDSEGMVDGHYDAVLHGKKGYLNMTFFIIRQLIYFGLWIFFWKKFRSLSINEDLNGGIASYNSSVKYAAAFVPVYGLSFVFFAYDWLMSIEPHWYSTMYGVNVFAGAFVGNFLIQIIIIFTLQQNGYMGYVNNSHYHDIGKFIFGFSIFWTYTWVSQFLLIWYANLPEEITYYLMRMEGGWKYLFFTNLFINFIFPFLALMMRDAKRTKSYLLGVVIVLLIGRYIDWYLATMPAAAKEQAGFGFYEIGFFLLFGGIFAFTVARQLAKANLAPVNHPYLGESLHHEI